MILRPRPPPISVLPPATPLWSRRQDRPLSRVQTKTIERQNAKWKLSWKQLLGIIIFMNWLTEKFLTAYWRGGKFGNGATEPKSFSIASVCVVDRDRTGVVTRIIMGEVYEPMSIISIFYGQTRYCIEFDSLGGLGLHSNGENNIISVFFWILFYTINFCVGITRCKFFN
ncbi:hypothetical protein GWI33_016912 [Rhynchophorus ferrugineus]|uniref:Uncharacterized protein n=1 Tax=Rhynchophorus ferrugineus TaxID=354439 RepID=A0A834I075_RHYFE|nr:hypothetical protein GWI33_016912 [Rhynchophorus ferrugineus]